jgi:uncharacterized protein YndB with AHSA1/START domain
MLDGEFVPNGEGGALSFERRLDKSVEKVWAALTVAERVADWCGNKAEIDLRLGGAFRIVWPENMGEMTGVITALKPHTLLEYSWFEPNVKVAASRVRWTLKPDGAGCILRLDHIFDVIDPKSVTEFAGGWDDLIVAVENAADRRATPPDLAGQKDREARYAAKFGG